MLSLRTPTNAAGPFLGVDLYADGNVLPCLINGRYVEYRSKLGDDVSTRLYVPVGVTEGEEFSLVRWAPKASRGCARLRKAAQG